MSSVQPLIPALIAACLALLGLALEQNALQQGFEAFKRHDLKTAESELHQATGQEPLNAQAWKLLGMTYIAEEKYEQASEPCQKACQLNPHEPNACYYLGRVNFTLGRLRESLAAYQAALDNGEEKGRVYLGLGLTYAAMSRPREAESSYLDAIKAGNVRAKTEYGLFLFHQGTGFRKPSYSARSWC